MARGVAKGVDYYVYSDSADLLNHLGVPLIDRKHGPEGNFKPWNMQIQSRNIRPVTRYVGGLEWVTRQRGVDMIRHKQDISALTGNLWEGTMSNMFNTPPRLGNPTVCWGFYDAGGGGGVSKLTNQHQLYINATRDHRRWMSELAARNARVATEPFARFALPGAHDAGMFDMTAVMEILNDGKLVDVLLRSLVMMPKIGAFIAAAGGVSRAFGPRAIANLAMTQKDDVRTMLDIGTRYFDFRPGTMHPSIQPFGSGIRYHQHSLIPGYPYIAFLEDVLRWLVDNPGEIVVVSANTQGMFQEQRPSPAAVQADLDAALRRVAPSPAIAIGGKPHIEQSYEALIESNTRLIFLNQIAGETRKYDSWNASYATLTAAPIIRAFERMRPTVPGGEDYVVLQMQAMSPAVGAGVVVPSIVTLSNASSPLLATKGAIDIKTNAWLRNHARRLSRDHLLVLLNDFIDNCTVETAIQLTEQRVQPPGSGPRPTPS